MDCVVTDIYWERVFLHLVLEGARGKRLYLRGDAGFVALRQEDGTGGDAAATTSKVVLNLSAVVNRTFLENGSWVLGYFDTDEQPQALNDAMAYPNQPKRIKMSPGATARHNKAFSAPSAQEGRPDPMRFCMVADSLAEKLCGLDKVFRYSGGTYAYTVDFTVGTVDDATMFLSLNSFFVKRDERWDKRFSQPKGFEDRFLVGRLKGYGFGAKRMLIRAFYKAVSRLYPDKRRNILLLSATGASLQGNLAAVHDRIKERGLDRQFNVDVSCREAVGRRSTKRSWLAEVRRIAKAGLIFIDNYAPVFTHLDLDRRTRLVQLWHAGAGFKGVGYMRFGKEGSPLPGRSVHKRYAHALAPSKPLVKVFEEVFGIEGEAFLPIGMPRLDGYLDPGRAERFREGFYREHPELAGKRAILFAPTYRGEGQPEAYYDYSKVDFGRLYDFCGDEYVLLVRMHPFIKDRDGTGRAKPDLTRWAGRVYDFSGWGDINELFYVTDILITDYSSAYYEFSLFRRPILFYTYDRLLYENTRGVYQGVKDSAPGKVCDTFDALMEALEAQDFDIGKTVAFAEEHFPCAPEGATDRLLDELLFSHDQL
ncbi:MAG: CDP-glycerol glycerophosphotransferase family protein [Eggerthellaceae bacterium]|nr:CDP-glycerol glycerophosphotransferase family protein [Eggerthellaceae bacterium]